MSAHPMPADRPAPPLGGDSESVLRAAGLAEREIEEALCPESDTAGAGPGKERA